MPRTRSALVPTLLLVAGACRHAIPPAPVPADWQNLVRPARPFAAMYRLSCCGHRDLVLTVRGDTSALAVAVAVPPGGTALAAWVESDGGWLDRVKERCREPLPKGALPLSGGASLPLDPAVAALLLAGLLPAGSHEIPGQPGWVEASTDAYWWRARLEGPEPRWTRLVVGRSGGASPILEAVRSDRTSLPHSLSLTAGSVKAELTLREWRPADPPAPPGWMAAPVCGGAS